MQAWIQHDLKGGGAQPTLTDMPTFECERRSLSGIRGWVNFKFWNTVPGGAKKS